MKELVRLSPNFGKVIGHDPHPTPSLSYSIERGFKETLEIRQILTQQTASQGYSGRVRNSWTSVWK